VIGPPAKPGDKVFFTGYFFNSRGKKGMPANPVSTYIQFGTLMQSPGSNIAA
jgi:hypothetical protein